jgi:hypothetical protein
MNKKIIIIGALSLVGVGAFFYLKRKKTMPNQNSLTDTGLASNSVLPTISTPTPTSTISVPASETSVKINDVVLTTPVEVVETAIKISEAKNIATKIFDIRNKINRYSYMDDLRQWAKETDTNWTWESELPEKKKNYLFNLNKGIKELDKTLALLGYTEVNGSIQKI